MAEKKSGMRAKFIKLQAMKAILQVSDWRKYLKNVESVALKQRGVLQALLDMYASNRTRIQTGEEGENTFTRKVGWWWWKIKINANDNPAHLLSLIKFFCIFPTYKYIDIIQYMHKTISK